MTKPQHPAAQAQDILSRQARAADPRQSVWVSASAGSGKTRVLVNRLIALMLNNAAPERILCLTYTKAAAAEMANRLSKILQDWATWPDDKLRQSAAQHLPPHLRNVPLIKLRRLFGHVSDCPGGMRIETIHGFCQSVLKRFPLEAGLPPHFTVLEESAAAALIQQARNDILGNLAAESPDLAASFALLIATVREHDVLRVLESLIGRRGRLRRLFEDPAAIDRSLAALQRALALNPGQSLSMDDLVTLPAAAESSLRAIARQALEVGSPTDKEKAIALSAFLAGATDERLALWEDYQALWLTAKKTPQKTIFTKSVLGADPGYIDIAQHEQARVGDLLAKLAAQDLLAANGAILRVAGAVLRRYETLKQRHAVVDYEDLIAAVHRLVTDRDQTGWVLYKLDGGIDHLLIDEAQDTSPVQWEILDAIADEFFAGIGARNEGRTVFAVGDPKQSIYSFQDAAPDQFTTMRDQWGQRINSAGRDDLRWEPVPLHTSFRSAPAILNLVDSVFAAPDAANGVDLDGDGIRHEPYHVGQIFGRVELWPLAKNPNNREKVDDETAAESISQPTEKPPYARVADEIADRVVTILNDPTPLSSTKAAARPGDILILVRRRGSFTPDIIRALQRRGIPVAGSDRLRLTQHLAVNDLMAAGQFALLPDDDLTLACLLKSPLIGFDDDELFALAHDRGGQRLWHRLRQSQGDKATQAVGLLARWLQAADFISPYEFFARILIGDGGRERLLARLGNEAAEPIDEFLNLALDYERTHAPSLQGFLDHVSRGDPEIKRDADPTQAGEVRIMTVHGAKGLEAPIVILPDTGQLPGARDKLLWQTGLENDGCPVWAQADFPIAALASIKDVSNKAAMAEYRRLLYVALTRARERLYVTGWIAGKSQEPPSGSWYDLIARGISALTSSQDAFAAAGRDPEGWYGDKITIVADPILTVTTRADSAAAYPVSVPGWLTQPAPAEATPPRPLAPSRLDHDTPPVDSPLRLADQWALRRGRIIHRLMEILPDLDSAHWDESCAKLLARETDLPHPVRDTIRQSVLEVLRHPDAAAFFNDGSVAEAPIAGHIITRDGTMLPIAAQVDRLSVTSDSIWIIDYKTNRTPPAKPEDVPIAYLRQMAVYRTVLSAIYPDRAIRTALLWTEGPTIMPLPEEILAAHIP